MAGSRARARSASASAPARYAPSATRSRIRSWAPSSARTPSAAARCALVATWRAAMVDALPFTAKTAIAFVNDGDRAAATVYDGTKEVVGERRRDFALAREFPAFADLERDGHFADHARQLFVPLVAWAASARIETHVASRDAPADA